MYCLKMSLYIGLINLQIDKHSIDNHSDILPYTLFTYDYIKNDLDKVLSKAK